MATKKAKNPLHKVSAEVIKKAAKKVGVKKIVNPHGVLYEPEELQSYVQKQVEGIRAEVKEVGRKQGMIQGLCLAICYMYKGENEKGIWKSAGLTIDECIANEVAEYDMDEIVKHWKELQGIPDGNY